MIDEFEEVTGERVDKSFLTPATGNLFKVNMSAAELDVQKSKLFHTNTAKVLYIIKSSRPDIGTSVSYLMRHVTKSDIDDWIKLKRVLGF